MNRDLSTTWPSAAARSDSGLTTPTPLAQGPSIGYALTVFDDRLIIGGFFDYVGLEVAHNVVAWDGHYWLPFGGGVNGEVHALAVHDGRLIVGGAFTTAGDVPARNIAAWDGTKWDSLGAGLNGAVWCLLSSDSALYVGGDFLEAGGLGAAHVARWQDSAWNSLADGVNARVNTLAPYHGDLWAGGEFSVAGGLPAVALARWNGSSWDSIPGELSECNPNNDCVVSVTALLPLGDSLYVTGNFKQAGTLSASGVAIQRNETWGALGAGFVPVSAMCMLQYEGQPIAAGRFHSSDPSVHEIAAWDGTDWQGLGDGLYGLVLGLAEYHGDLYATGGIEGTYYGFLPLLGIARWDGSAWFALEADPIPPVPEDARWWDGFTPENGVDNRIAALSPFQGEMVAGGQFRHAGADSIPFVARFDGATWHPLGLGTSYDVYALCEFNGELVVGGGFGLAGGQVANSIAAWTGSAWHDLAGGTDGPVNALCVWNGRLYAGGNFTVAGGTAVSCIAAWDGTHWEPLGTGVNYIVTGLTVWRNTLVAVGAFWKAGTLTVNCVAQWDGSAWHALDGGVSDGHGVDTSLASAAVAYGDTLVVGGIIREAGGIEAWSAARWDGAAWDSLGPGLTGPPNPSSPAVYALTVHQGQLIAGGIFSTSGDTLAPGVARWNGRTWLPLGTSLTMPNPGTQGAWALGQLNGNLYVGGYFSHAGGKPVSNIARWDSVATTDARGTDPPRDQAHALSLRFVSRASDGAVRLRYALPQDQAVTLRILDVRGRVVDTLIEGPQPSGTGTVRWPRAGQAQTPAAGVYVAWLNSGGQTYTARFALVR